MQLFRQVSQANATGTMQRGQGLRPLSRTVGNGDRPWRLGSKVCGTQLNHFASSDKQDTRVLDIFENATGQTHTGRGHADGMSTNFSGGTNLFRDGKGTLKKLIQRGAHCPCIGGQLHRIFELPQYLRLTQDHRVKSAGDPKGMTR